MASEKTQIYRCNKCGIITEVLEGGAGALVCCGEPMEQLEGNTVDAAKEKHVPVIEKTGDGYKVSVGSTLHPMESDHYIQWIELMADSRIYRRELKPGGSPEAVFHIEARGPIIAREYCNKHGLWKAQA